MEEESRDEKLLRVLSSGISGKGDWVIAKYLIDMKYANGNALLSNMESSVGEILDIFLQGPTAEGRDFIEGLRIRIRDAKKIENKNPDDSVEQIGHDEHWYKKPIGIIGLTVISGAILIVVAHLLRVHLNISQ